MERSASVNRIVIEGAIVQRGALRYTPVGIPVVEFAVEHVSEQQEDGSLMAVRLRLQAIAIGSLAATCAGLAEATPIKLAGFLASRSARNDTPVLHVQAVRILDNPI